MTPSIGDHRDPCGDDIAIVGMSCLFPGADTPARFWQNIVGKVDCITDAPANWQPELFYGPDDPNIDRAYTQRGGFLGDLCRFNPTKYGVVPSSIEGAEPDHFIALRCAYEAFADAGWPGIPLPREKTGIIIGRGVFTNRGWVSVFQQLFAVDQVLGVLRRVQPQLSESDLAAIKAELKQNLPPASAETFPGLVHSALVGRIANRLDLNGPAYTIDAACAATLLAVDQGIHELRSRRCDTVLVGGAQVSTPPQIQILFCKLQALSKAGKIAPFSAEADGTMLGQGCGMLVLKRLADATRDGNRVYALIQSIGSSSDGKGAGLLAPRTEGQQLAIRRAYDQSGIDPATVELLEAHGTGIPMGDATEMESIRQCFASSDPCAPRIAFGSVKSMIGHLIPAAGAASLIKTALALYHRTLPPSLHAERSAPGLELESTRFFVCGSPLPWLHGDTATPRRAGINAFGFGGINCHAVLEEHRPTCEVEQPRLERQWPFELVVIQADDREALRAKAERLADWIAAGTGVALLDIAASCAAESGSSRLAIVTSSREDLVKKLLHAARLLAEPDRQRIQDRKGVFWQSTPLATQGRLAFVFPGEGSQYVGMHAELCRHFPEVRRQIEHTDLALRQLGTTPLAELLYPRPERASAAEAELFQMETALAAVTASARGLLDLLGRLEIQADAVVGHSSGEFAAVLASGAYRPATEEELVQSIIDGTNSTAAVAASDLAPHAVLTSVGGAEPEAVEQVVSNSDGRLLVAMDNCPHQVILVGDEEATTKALAALQGKGGVCQRLPWNRPYHTPAVAPVCQFVEAYMAKLPLQSPAVEIWSCATTAPMASDPAAIRDLVVRQWRMPVRFRETLLHMHAAGARLFIEVGPRGNLASFIADSLGDHPHAVVALDSQRKGDIEQLCHALGLLASHGVPMNLAKLYDRRTPNILDLTQPPPAPPAPDPILKLELPTLELSDSLLERLSVNAKSSLPSGPAPAAKVQSPIAATNSLSNGNGNGKHRVSASSPSCAGHVMPMRGRAAAPATAPSPPDARSGATARSRAMAEFQHTMQTFLRTQQDCVGALLRPRQLQTFVSAPAPSENPLPDAQSIATAAPAPPAGLTPTNSRPLHFVQQRIEHRPGQRLVAECELSLDTEPFLTDHTFFGRGLSVADPTLSALPIMPMAMTLEIMAQAAAALLPDLQVVAVSDIRASRWLAFESTTRRVRMIAEAISHVQAQVKLVEADRDGMDSEIASATVEMATTAPSLGAPRLRDDSDVDVPWDPAELYQKVLYHGPTFQGIRQVERWGQRGIRTLVVEPPQDRLFGQATSHLPLLPVTLTDTASQIPGLRNGNWQESGAIVPLAFPNSIARLEFIADRQVGRELTAIASFDQQDGQLLSDVEIVDRDGRVVLRYLGKTEEVVDFPLSLYRYASAPNSIRCSRDLSQLFADADLIDACTICESHIGQEKLFVKRVWAQVLARMILSRSERAEMAASKLPPLPTAEWLFGRVAAKDAIRRHAQLEMPMADILIGRNESGAPIIQNQLDSPLQLSIAHKGLYGVAVTADSNRVGGIGIDVETLLPLDPALVADSFDEQERTILAQVAVIAGLTQSQAGRAAWAAKEAIGKALGAGLIGGPRSIQITAASDGLFLTRLAGPLQSRYSSQSAPLVAHWRLHGDHALALCVIPREQFLAPLSGDYSRN